MTKSSVGGSGSPGWSGIGWQFSADFFRHAEPAGWCFHASFFGADPESGSRYWITFDGRVPFLQSEALISN